MTQDAAAAFAAEVDRLDPDPATRAALDHWRRAIAAGQVSGALAAQIPSQAISARGRLLSHLRRVEQHENLEVDEVHRRYPGLFESVDIPGVTEVLIGMQPFGQVSGMSLGLDVPELERWLSRHSPREVLRRFEKLEEWMGRYHKTNHDGNFLTPLLLRYLAAGGDFDARLAHLAHLKQETRQGRFQIGNDLQRDLEFRRFAYEYTRVLEPLTYVLRGRYPPPMTNDEMYAHFVELEEMPAEPVEEYTLSERELAESRRAAYEAFEFLRFLRDFRSRTARHIVVIGNDRFGRQWVVEPIEEYLDDSFSLRYDRVRSGASTRLSVPAVFPRSFVRRLSDQMPHVVIADGCHASADPEVMVLSRGLRDYGNWFAVFNDLRAQGNGLEYQHESLFPPGHFPELQKWHEFAAEKERIADWVAPGPTYRVTAWAPEMRDEVMLGDERACFRPAELAGDRPLVVLANAIFDRTEGADLPDALRGTTPRYFDDPDDHVSDSVVFGFGAHGLETRRRGTSTEKFVAAVQRQIVEEIRRLSAPGAR